MKDATSRTTRLRAIAWALWLLTFLLIGSDVALRPAKHNTDMVYRGASVDWWAGQDPYSYRNHDAFLYLPTAAILFTPFAYFPDVLGDLAWRAVTFGLFAWAVVRLADFFLARGDRDPPRTFLLLTLLAVPSAFASLRNGQFDLPLAALLLLATVEVADARWNVATFWLCLAVALKPLAIVPLLLFGGVHPLRLLPRLLLGLVLVLAIPFLHWNPAFVAHEYVRLVQTLTWATVAEEPRYSDLAALLSHVAIYPPYWLKTLARALFAPAYLALGAVAFRRLNPAAAAWAVGALAADYLMLFNPRTETCSYVFLGPFLASAALLFFRVPARKWLGWALAFGALGCACDAMPVIHGLTDRWLKPLIALLFLPVLVYFIFEKPVPKMAKASAGQPA